MLPEESGIANFNAKVFGTNKNFDVFSNFKSYKNFITACKYLNNDYKYNFIPLEYFDKNNNYKNNYNKKIFVLGNSHHNIPYLKICYRNRRR